jgi:hypothetical protein
LSCQHVDDGRFTQDFEDCEDFEKPVGPPVMSSDVVLSIVRILSSTRPYQRRLLFRKNFKISMGEVRGRGTKYEQTKVVAYSKQHHSKMGARVAQENNRYDINIRVASKNVRAPIVSWTPVGLHGHTSD